MKRAWTFLEKLLHPPKWVLLTLPPIVFAALTYVLLKGKNSMPAYMIYCMSAYCLTIWILPLPRLFRKAKANMIHRLTGTVFGGKYIGDLAFRGSVSIYQGMMVNFLYVVFRIFVGIRYASVWFLTIAIYYLLLGIMRLSLILRQHRIMGQGDSARDFDTSESMKNAGILDVFPIFHTARLGQKIRRSLQLPLCGVAPSYRNRNMKSELRCYRRMAWLLFLLNIPMGGMIVLMVLTDSGYSYPGYVIYLSALYTFYTIILAIVNLVKFRKLGSPILSAAKVLNFVAALMSLLGLQTAMLSQFSTEGEAFRRRMNAITGGGVWFSVILTAVYMLLRSRKLKEVKSFEPLGE